MMSIEVAHQYERWGKLLQKWSKRLLIQDATGQYVYITNSKSIIERYSYSLDL